MWGLDDYNFLPFIWGSAQLVNHPLIRPKSIHNPEIMEEFTHEYLYLGCIAFVKQVSSSIEDQWSGTTLRIEQARIPGC